MPSTAEKYAKSIQKSARKALIELIETKHLYQSVEIERSEPGALAKKTGIEIKETAKIGQEKSEFRLLCAKLKKNEIDVYLPSDWYLQEEVKRRFDRTEKIIFTQPDVTTSCAFCGKPDAVHLPVQSRIQSKCGGSRLHEIKKVAHQVINLVYQCSNCRESSQGELVFTVTRKGFKLQLTGRSEFEEVIAPKICGRRREKGLIRAV
jgi:hypothetical protein